MSERTQIRARFDIGDQVSVLELEKLDHVRTPYYIRGKTGKVVEFCGYFLNPENLAVGLTNGPVCPLYRIRFVLKDLWPEYARADNDELFIEVYDHWLEKQT